MAQELYDLASLQEAADNAGLDYYGEYNGRAGHQGYAVTVSDERQMMWLGVQLGAEGMHDIIDHAHVDSLGRGTVVSFPRRLFKP